MANEDNRNNNKHDWIRDEETRVVEKQRRPYTGFITDEEIKEGQRLYGFDARKNRISGEVSGEQEDLTKTRIFDAGELRSRDRETVARKRKYRTIRISDDRKFRRLVAVLVVFAVLLAAEIGYAAMRINTSKIPAKADEVKAETSELISSNKELTKESEEYGNYEEKKELRKSWERLRNKLSESE